MVKAIHTWLMISWLLTIMKCWSPYYSRSVGWVFQDLYSFENMRTIKFEGSILWLTPGGKTSWSKQSRQLWRCHFTCDTKYLVIRSFSRPFGLESIISSMSLFNFSITTNIYDENSKQQAQSIINLTAMYEMRLFFSTGIMNQQWHPARHSIYGNAAKFS